MSGQLSSQAAPSTTWWRRQGGADPASFALSSPKPTLLREKGPRPQVSPQPPLVQLRVCREVPVPKARAQLQLHPDTVPSLWRPHKVPRETLPCPPPHAGKFLMGTQHVPPLTEPPPCPHTVTFPQGPAMSHIYPSCPHRDSATSPSPQGPRHILLSRSQGDPATSLREPCQAPRLSNSHGDSHMSPH